MPSIRVFYPKEKGLRGRCRMNFNWPPIKKNSVVLISAAEATVDTGSLFGIENAVSPNLGDADVYVTNVGAHEGGVEFILHVNWNDPLPILVDILVVGPHDQFSAQ